MAMCSSSMVVLLLGMCIQGQGLQFSVTPSPNITTLQSAVFRCTVDVVVPITWTVDETSSADSMFQSYISSYGILHSGAGTQDTTLTIPGDPVLNGTVIQCNAFGKIINDELYSEVDSDTLYIQGPPASVDLYCSHQSVYTIKCTWIVPYTLPSVDITGYNINISNATSNLIMMTVDVTEYTYNVSEFGNYTVSVVATIGELEGVIDTAIVDVPEVTINDYSIGLLYKNHVLHSNSSIQDTELVESCLDINTITLNTLSSIDREQQYVMSPDCSRTPGSIFAETIIPEDKRKDHLNIYLVIEYKNGILVNSTQVYPLSIFDVQHFSITDDPSSGLVCFECIFIPGTTMPGCHIQYSSSETNFSGKLTIGLTKHCQILYTGIDNDNNDDDTIPKLITNEYIIKASDINYSDVTAVESVANITVTNTTSSPSNTSNDPSTEPSTIATSNITTSSTTDILLSVLTAYVGGGISAAFNIILVLVIVVLIILLCCKDSKKHDKAEQLSTTHVYSPRTAVNVEDDSYYSTEFGQVSRNHSNNNTEFVLSMTNKDSTSEYFSQSDIVSADQPLFSYEFVVDKVASVIPHKWKEFGKAIAITPPKLQEIRDNNPDNDRSTFCDIVHEWQSSRTTRPFTPEVLVLVLNSIGERELLNIKELESKM